MSRKLLTFMICVLCTVFSCKVKSIKSVNTFENAASSIDTSICLIPFVKISDEHFLAILDSMVTSSNRLTSDNNCSELMYYSLSVNLNESGEIAIKVLKKGTRGFISLSSDHEMSPAGFYHNNDLFLFSSLKSITGIPFADLQDSLIGVQHCNSVCLPSYSLGEIIYYDNKLTFNFNVERMPDVYFENGR